MNATQAADGILRIAATAMSYAVKGVTTERGLDAGDFALVAYGGAGPLHAVAVAREIGIRNVIIPARRACSRRSACCSRTCATITCAPHLMRLEDAPFDEIETVFRELEQQGRDAIAATLGEAAKITVKRAVDMRYVGPGASGHGGTADQACSRSGPQGDQAALRRPSLLRYGTSAPDERAEIVSLRAPSTGVMKKPPQEKISGAAPRRRKSASTGKRSAIFTANSVDTPTYRARRAAGRQPDQRARR